jgi:hypothetical protein
VPPVLTVAARAAMDRHLREELEQGFDDQTMNKLTNIVSLY